MALVNYNKCSPEKCQSGICPAALACERKLMKQESPYDIPMTDPAACRACPLKAIEIVTM